MLPTRKLLLGGLFEIAVPTDSVSSNNNICLSKFGNIKFDVIFM